MDAGEPFEVSRPTVLFVNVDIYTNIRTRISAELGASQKSSGSGKSRKKYALKQLLFCCLFSFLYVNLSMKQMYCEMN